MGEDDDDEKMLDILALYDDDLDALSAVFTVNRDYFAEVRVDVCDVWVWSSTETRKMYPGRLTCRHGKKLFYERFETVGDSRKYFWDFIRDPDLYMMTLIL